MKIVIMIHGLKSLKKKIKNTIDKTIIRIHKYTKRTNFKNKKDKILNTPILDSSKTLIKIIKITTTIDLTTDTMKTIDHTRTNKAFIITQPKRTKRILIPKINIPKISKNKLKVNSKIVKTIQRNTE